MFRGERTSPHAATALAVFSGSLGSRGGGALAVLTEQNRHPLVHVSPINIIVAVAVPDSPPLKQNETINHIMSPSRLQQSLNAEYAPAFPDIGTSSLLADC